MPELDISALTDLADARLAAADADLAARFPGERAGRQPVHTAYVPADHYRPDVTAAWRADALEGLDRYRDVFTALAGEDDVERVRAKLRAQPIEDLRVDFEDGYGAPEDSTEDAHALRAATGLAAAAGRADAPVLHGIRMKCLEAPTRARGLRTLGIVVEEYLIAGGDLDRFVVTLPKVTSVDQVETMAAVCEHVEETLGLAGGALRFELQIETPQSIVGPDGSVLVARMIHAAAGRCTGLHFGTYDYTASCGIAAEYQSMAHPAADFAKLAMQAAAAGTGVRLSDGSTNVLPVGGTEQVRAAWSLHLDLVARSLERGLYQGWDLHPMQLPTRYAATFGFYRAALPRAVNRLAAWTGGGGGTVADEPATARALADYLLRALECGAADVDEVTEPVGIDLAELRRLARPHRSGVR